MPPSDGRSGWAISGVMVHLGESFDEVLPRRAAEQLGVDPGRVRRWWILRRSLDARGRRAPRYVCRVGVELAAGHEPRQGAGTVAWQPTPAEPPIPLPLGGFRPVVVGSGPAGLFAALRLCALGAVPVVVERGQPMRLRTRDVAAYWRRGVLDRDSNVAFGEGGAGTFSDGKLTYRGRDPLRPWVFETLVEHGAPETIFADARPHLGTDRLRTVVSGLRRGLEAAGVSFRFGTRVEGLRVDEGRVTGVCTTAGELPADAVVFAPGHGARELLRAVVAQGALAEAKGFAMGVRAEMAQESLDRGQYGRWWHHPDLPPAEFSVRAAHQGRGVYSFCMCPGGTVVPAGTEPSGLVVNGMSGSRRSGARGNAALVVTVDPTDFGSDPLKGFRFQQVWEERAQVVAGFGRVPVQSVAAFLGGGAEEKSTSTSCPWAETPTDLARCLPPFVDAALRKTLPSLIRQLPPLADGVLVGVETRTSSPLRLLRDGTGMSPSLPGLYPAGEGAGTAGGIISAAVDGARAADRCAARWASTRSERG